MPITTPQRDLPSFDSGGTLVIDVGVGTSERPVQSGPTRMNETKPRQTRVGPAGLENGDPVVRDAVGLAVIPGDKTNLMAPQMERLGD
jgi:hypothetical protein